MKGSPLVSVVIPVKDGAETIAESIESVLAQDYRPFEVIVVLAESTDATEGIVRTYDGVSVVDQVSRGIVGGFNEGVGASSGEFVAFNGDDDIWLPDKLSTQMAVFEREPATQVVTCLMEYFLSPGETTLPAGFRPHLLEGAHPGHNCETMVARRSLFDEIGPFDPEFDVAFDVEFFARVADAGAVHGVVQQTLVRKRIHASAHHLAFADRNNQQLLRIAARSMARKRSEGGN